jgi:hypothetical protein
LIEIVLGEAVEDRTPGRAAELEETEIETPGDETIDRLLVGFVRYKERADMLDLEHFAVEFVEAINDFILKGNGIGHPILGVQ